MRDLQPQLTWGESLLGYASLFKRSLKASFAYRSSTVTSLLTAAFMYAIPLLVWRQVYAQNPGGLSIPPDRMFPYLLLACCVNYALSMSVEFRVGQRIRDGLIATDLLKPVDFQVSQGVQCVSDGLFNGSLGLVVFLCGYLALGPSIFPTSAASFGLFLVSFLLAFLLQYLICFVFVQGAFFTYSGYGIFAARGALHQTFSGMAAMLELYPPLLRSVGNWLPFQHTIYTPVCIYQGRFSLQESGGLILEQLAWIAGLALLGRFLMARALRQLEVQGG